MARFVPFVLLAALLSFAALHAADDAKKPDARALGPFDIDLGDPTHQRLFTSNKSYVISSEKEAVKLFGKTLGPALIEGVDFTKEQAVIVSWITGGPPFGTLMWHAPDETSIEFYIKAPRARARGEAARFGVDRFAVPADVKVTFDPKER